MTENHHRPPGSHEAQWFKMPLTAIKDFRFRCMTSKAQVLYLHLARLRDRRDSRYWIQYSDEVLAFESGLSRSSVYRARYELEMNGFIRYKTTINKKACRYQVIDSPVRGLVHKTLLGPENGDENPAF